MGQNLPVGSHSWIKDNSKLEITVLQVMDYLTVCHFSKVYLLTPVAPSPLSQATLCTRGASCKSSYLFLARLVLDSVHSERESAEKPGAVADPSAAIFIK